MTLPSRRRMCLVLFLVVVFFSLLPALAQSGGGRPSGPRAASVGQPDFDGDGRADILWQNPASGDVAVWLMDGTTKKSAAVVLSGVDRNWKIVGTGDFDGDLKTDILWQNPASGDVAVWLMDGTVKKSAAVVVSGVDSNWKIVRLGDFDGDTKADILWRNNLTRDVAVWLMDGVTRKQSAIVVGGVDPNWKIVGVGDFNADTRADILWQNAVTGDVAVWLMNGAAKQSGAVVVSGVQLDWKVVGVGDFNGDTKADILWQNSATGTVAVWVMDGLAKQSGAYVATGVEPLWRVSGIADFDANTTNDILWRHEAEGNVAGWLMDGTTKSSAAMVATGVDPNWTITSPPGSVPPVPPPIEGTYLGATIPPSPQPNAFFGDATLNHSNNTFVLVNRTQNFTYSGTMVSLATGFLQLTTVSSNDPRLALPAHGYALEVTDTVFLFRPTDTDDLVYIGAKEGPCSALASTLNFNMVKAFQTGMWDSNNNTAYMTSQVTPSGSVYLITDQAYYLDGTAKGSGGAKPMSCSDGVASSPPAPQEPEVFSTLTTTGLVITVSTQDEFHNDGNIGFLTPGSPVNVATLVSGQYRGMIFRPKSGPLQLVGFGPGSGTSIQGGTWAAIDSNPFSAHANNITLNLTGQPSNGLLRGSIVDSQGTHPFFIAAVTQIGGKFVLYGLATDGSSNQPYEIFLAQQ